MQRSPGAHTRHMQRAAEVVLVHWLHKPAALTRRLARLTTGVLAAVLLPSAVARIRTEQLPAAQAFTSSSSSPHRSAPATRSRSCMRMARLTSPAPRHSAPAHTAEEDDL